MPWACVDLNAATVEISHIIVGVRDGDPKTRRGKTRGSLSVMAIPTDGVAALREQFAAQTARKREIGAAWREHGLVFDRGDGGAWRHDQVETAFYDALKAAGLPRCRFHDLRGASLSALREAKHDLIDIQRRARHADISTTASRYIRASNEADVRAADALEDLVHDAASKSNAV